MAFSLTIDYTINALILNDSENELFSFYDIKSIILVEASYNGDDEDCIDFKIGMDSKIDEITFYHDRDNMIMADLRRICYDVFKLKAELAQQLIPRIKNYDFKSEPDEGF